MFKPSTLTNTDTMKKNKTIFGMAAVLFSLVLFPFESKAQMETKAGDMVLTAGVGFSDLSYGFNGNFQFNITNKIAVHPSFNYNTYGGGSLLSIDAWGAYHGLKNIPFLNASADGKDNVAAYVMLGPTFFSGEDDNGFAFGGGGGARYFFNPKLAVSLEGKYRMIIGDAYSNVRWYELGLGISYALK